MKRKADWPHLLAALLSAFCVLSTASVTEAAGPFEVGPPPPTADRIDFTVSLRPADPFSPTNDASGKPKGFRRGEVVTVEVRGTPRPGYHTYPITQRSSDPEQLEGMLTKWNFAQTPGLKPLGRISETAPQWAVEEGVGVFLEHSQPFIWSRDLLILPDATAGQHKLAFTLDVEVCDKSCINGTHRFEVPLTISEEPALALSEGLQKQLTANDPLSVQLITVPDDLKDKTSQALEKLAQAGSPPSSSAPAPAPIAVGTGDLLGVLLASMAAAIAMLFTPCVFPMIPITVSFFLKQSEKEHHNALVTALVYSGTIILVLALAVLLLGKLIVDLADNPWMNLGLGLLLVVFALSLFGMYELELPHSLAQFTSSREGKGRYLGAVFMALTFTITSFTCTGPFLGPLLVAAKELQLSLGRLVLAALVYSATFAAPFFVLALFPSLIKKLPKSGGWLNAVKVVMGFLELAAALKFLANTDIGWNPGNPRIFNYETVICAWIILSVACGLYLLGLYRLPHDTPADHIGAGRMLLATIFMGLALYMTPALWRKQPQGIVGEALLAFAPLDTKESPVGSAWHLDYQTAWQQAVKENKDIFIDFTGVNCTNCRSNENRIFPQPEVRKELEKFVRVQLYTDSVPKPGLTQDEARSEALRNAAWESATFQEASRPLYVVFRPDRSRAEADGRLQGATLGVKGGLISTPQDFLSFLRSSQSQQVSRRD
jgi:thiol:disulfide interchange protein DsbD